MRMSVAELIRRLKSYDSPDYEVEIEDGSIVVYRVTAVDEIIVGP